MKLLDSLNDGKTLPESPTSEVTPTKLPEESGDEKKDEETKDKEPPDGDQVSRIHVAANIGGIILMLVSKDEQWADIRVKGMNLVIQ